MKRYLLPLTGLALTAALALPALAQTVPTVREGDFYCFRGLDVNVLPAAPGAARHKAQRRADKLGDSKFDNSDGHDLREVKTEGEMPVLVILVEFDNQTFSLNRGKPYEPVNAMLNDENYRANGATGSANEYFRSISDGKFSPKFDLYGPVKLQNNKKEYGAKPTNQQTYETEDGKTVNCYHPGFMIREAVEALDDQIDYTKYDTDGDGAVDFVYVFFAGRPYPDEIWPHAFTLNAALGAPVTLDGVQINRYATSAEYNINKSPSGIGTICHEFGHVLGLPDLYDTSSQGVQSKCFTPGEYDIMDAGEYNDNELTPPGYSSYERYALEWFKPVELTAGGDFTMLPLSARQLAYKVATASNPKEYFILEARAPERWDKSLPAHGMIVWHIDFDARIWDDNSPNNSANHQRVDLVEADDDQTASSRTGDVFPGREGICEFKKGTSPSFTDWKGKETGIELSHIERHRDGSVSFMAEAGGKKLPSASLEAPRPEITSATADGLCVSWPEVTGATGYMVSIYDVADFNGSLITRFADGYYYRDLGNATTITAEGLAPGHDYGVIVYAYNDVNASRSADNLTGGVLTADFATCRPNVYLHADNGVLTAEWDEVPGASSYELTVGDAEVTTAAEGVTAGFDDSYVEEGWTCCERYESRDRYCGAASPSLRCQVPGDGVTTPIFSDEIASVAFMAIKHYDDPCSIEVYGLDAQGRRFLVKTIAEPSLDKTTYTVNFPAGYHGASIAFRTLATGNDLWIDDVEVKFAESRKVAPAAGASVTTLSATSAQVTGLQADREYVAVVKATGADGTVTSREKVFRLSELTSDVEQIIGVDGAAGGFSVIDGKVVPADEAAPYDVFTIDGLCLAAGHKGIFTLPARGIFIVRNAATTVKISNY